MRNSDDDSFYKRLKRRVGAYSDIGATAAWFSEKYDRIQSVFEKPLIRGYVFAPVGALLSKHGATTAEEIQATITQVAVANAVLAGLPGKMGVGVFVSMALEAYMAYRIASFCGIRINRPNDIWKYVGVMGGILATILFLFRQALSFAFSLFSVIPGISPMIPAEFAVTCFVGVAFWVAFEQVGKSGSFSVPFGTWGLLRKRTVALVRGQWKIIRVALTPANISLMGQRLWAWLSGDIVIDKRQAALVRGDAAAAIMMSALLSGRVDQLQGPLGEIFMQAIRDRFPDLATASDIEVADRMRTYGQEQLGGIVSLIKGKMFEHLVALQGQPDDGHWDAKLFADESHPGSDIIFSDPSTGHTLEMSLKATDSPWLIEQALQRFPDYDVMTTSEVAKHFSGNDHVTPTEFSNEHLSNVTSQNLDELLGHVETLSTAEAATAAAAGPAASAAVRVWPYGVAFLRGKITRDEFERACIKILPSTGRSLAMRVALSFAMGPIYPWYVLARLTMKLVPNTLALNLNNWSDEGLRARACRKSSCFARREGLELVVRTLAICTGLAGRRVGLVRVRQRQVIGVGVEQVHHRLEAFRRVGQVEDHLLLADRGDHVADHAGELDAIELAAQGVRLDGDALGFGVAELAQV
jgi:hypothetical protein